MAVSWTLEEMTPAGVGKLSLTAVGPRSGSGAAEPPAAEDPLDPPPTSEGLRYQVELQSCRLQMIDLIG